ncbi:hypothetical protein L4A40_27120 [Bacillus cereus]|uniref:hypothetical protein n=1 Tax=Bacillus cereus TaxID=1396 RepID=UPI001F0E022C|nr:hypothetical protein [Bacillus cereus]MCH5476760.1 hypothetical protein [Bacillus cereus]
MKLIVNTEEQVERVTAEDLIQIQYHSGQEYTYAVMRHAPYVMLYNLSNGYSAFARAKATDFPSLLNAIKDNSNVKSYKILSADEYEMHVVRKGGR